jgi:hypothetical protein
MDGLATRVQRPHQWGNQKVLYDAKRHAHTAQGLALSTVWGDLLWVDGGWPGSCQSTNSSSYQGWARCWTPPRSPAWWTVGSGGWPGRASTGMRPSGSAGPRTTSPTRSGRSTASRRGYARWWNRRSPSWPTPGRCAAGARCCTGSGMSSAPPACWCASAAGSTDSPHDRASRTPSVEPRCTIVAACSISGKSAALPGAAPQYRRRLHRLFQRDPQLRDLACATHERLGRQPAFRCAFPRRSA